MTATPPLHTRSTLGGNPQCTRVHIGTLARLLTRGSRINDTYLMEFTKVDVAAAEDSSIPRMLKSQGIVLPDADSLQQNLS